MQIQSTKNLFSDRLKILIYGFSGVGKTTLARTTGEPTVILSAEAGLLSLTDSAIDVIDLTVDDTGALLPPDGRRNRLAAAYKYLNTDEARKRWKWVFIDSLTEINASILESLSGMYPDRKDALVMYGENHKRMKGLITNFRDLPHYNVVFTALAIDDKDDNNKRFIGCDLVGKISQKIHGYFDEVFYLRMAKSDEGEYIRQLITQPTDHFTCKDRSGKLSPIEPPDLSLIAAKIRGVK